MTNKTTLSYVGRRCSPLRFLWAPQTCRLSAARYTSNNGRNRLRHTRDVLLSVDNIVYEQIRMAERAQIRRELR